MRAQILPKNLVARDIYPQRQQISQAPLSSSAQRALLTTFEASGYFVSIRVAEAERTRGCLVLDKMTLFHFGNCVALAYFPYFILYKCSGL